MKPVTIDMLRAHLMAASLTAMGAEALILLVLRVSRISPQTLSSTLFRLLSLAVIMSGVIVLRQFARAAFDLALQSQHAEAGSWPARSVSIAANCPRRWLVVLHLRFTGRPFVLTAR